MEKEGFLKNGKTITNETTHLVTNVYEDDNFSRQVPGKKIYVSVSKGVPKQKLCNLKKSLCNLQELYTAFKEKHPNVDISFSKFSAFRHLNSKILKRDFRLLTKTSV